MWNWRELKPQGLLSGWPSAQTVLCQLSWAVSALVREVTRNPTLLYTKASILPQREENLPPRKTIFASSKPCGTRLNSNHFINWTLLITLKDRPRDEEKQWQHHARMLLTKWGPGDWGWIDKAKICIWICVTRSQKKTNTQSNVK